MKKPSVLQLPSRYGDNTLVLLVRDPWWIYAYWEVTPEKEAEARALATRQKLTVDKKVLRVYDVTGVSDSRANSFFDIEVGDAADKWYVEVGKPDRQWFAQIGLRAKDGKFFALVRSNTVKTPRFGFSDKVDEKWMLPDELFWKVAGFSSEGVGGQTSSLDLGRARDVFKKNILLSQAPSSKAFN